MRLTILLFATLKSRAGRSKVEVEVPEGASGAELMAALGAACPALAPALGSAVLAVNREFAFEDVALKPGDEVALFPPVSGGAAGPEVCAIAAEPFDLNDLVRRVTLPATGGVCAFTGIVRGQTAPERAGGDRLRETAHLNYEAYTAMAETKLRQVAAEIRSRWPTVQGVALVQRVGLLAVGEPTVAVVVSAAHRDQGIFEAARYGIDRIKEIVPVWKQEVGPEGETWVEGHYHPQPADTRAPHEME
jgi:molybdopterin synthase catalytic subunit/molybdopterin converting factor small subunit